MSLPNGGRFAPPRCRSMLGTLKLLRELDGAEAMGPGSTLRERAASFSHSSRVPEFIDGPVKVAAQMPAPNEYDVATAHSKLNERGRYPTQKRGPGRSLRGRGTSVVDEIAAAKRFLPGPGTYNPGRLPQRQSQAEPVPELGRNTSVESRRLFLAREVPGPGTYDVPATPGGPVLAVMKSGEARLPYPMPVPFDYNCQADVGRESRRKDSSDVSKSLMRMSTASSKLIDMLTTTPIAARVGTADQIYGRSRRRRRPTAKGLIDRKDHDPNFVARDVSSPHVIQANVESDIISELGVATFEASGGSPHTVVRSVEQTGRARPVDVDVDGQSKAAVPEWHSEEDFGATQEKQTHKSAVADEPGKGISSIEKRLEDCETLYSTELAGHLRRPKPKGLFLPESSVDRRIVRNDCQTVDDDDWLDFRHKRAWIAVKALSEAMQTLLDPLDTPVLLDRAEALLMRKLVSKAKLLGMTPDQCQALVRELPNAIAKWKSELTKSST
ncbi:hypothetical protein Pmar_PMAR022999 [Perkinsus marinus ATCC 50983]|uniref:Uncharacterized protein n=1 Tax=Perkinsus marinus (strain ATCC 50983 / TXsc) TaxID=423536 RepID=C5LHU8_PERM5|nr:hypothetical protein Pmar_PMAR022999 [Perkinsus marinus ATCC 50983]EER03702.1 hypothetical protein Pmar_PMAR022999 [Perkinsus marinus ATCC 50983]|eukprot:XP_002771886.1 hypothetical protein Pmar_PMAR022999 [Perkinsus marinus ATCC 50983]